jgi:hypothetical protein
MCEDGSGRCYYDGECCGGFHDFSRMEIDEKKLVECNGIHYFFFNFILQMILHIIELYFDWKPNFIRWGCCMILSLGGMVVGSKHINRS